MTRNRLSLANKLRSFAR